MMPFDGLDHPTIDRSVSRDWRAEIEGMFARIVANEERRQTILAALPPLQRTLANINGARRYDAYADLTSPREAFIALFHALDKHQRRAARKLLIKRTNESDNETAAARSIYREIVTALGTAPTFCVSSDPIECQHAVIEHLAIAFDQDLATAVARDIAEASRAMLDGAEHLSPEQRRLIDIGFHRRALKRRARLAHAHADVVLGLVGGRNGTPIVSPQIAAAYAEQQKRTQEWLAGTVAVPLDVDGRPIAGRAIPMSEIAKRSEEQRRSRRYTIALGLQDVARWLGWRIYFLTLTLPAEFHVGATKGMPGNAMNTPAHAAAFLQVMWHRAVNLLQKHAVPHFAFWAGEFHESSTRHRHVILCAPAESADTIAEVLTGGAFPTEKAKGVQPGDYINDWNIGPYRSDVLHLDQRDKHRTRADQASSALRALRTHSKQISEEWETIGRDKYGSKAAAARLWTARRNKLRAIRDHHLAQAKEIRESGALRGAFACSRVNIRVLQPEGDVLLDNSGQPMLDAEGQPKHAAALSSYILPYLDPALCPQYAAAAWAQNMRRSGMIGLRGGVMSTWHHLYVSAPEKLTDMPLARHIAQAQKEKRYGDALLDLAAFTSVGFLPEEVAERHVVLPVTEERVGGYGETYKKVSGIGEAAQIPTLKRGGKAWALEYPIQPTMPFTPPASQSEEMVIVQRGGVHRLLRNDEAERLKDEDHGQELAEMIAADHQARQGSAVPPSRTSAADLFTDAYGALRFQQRHRASQQPPLPAAPAPRPAPRLKRPLDPLAARLDGDRFYRAVIAAQEAARLRRNSREMIRLAGMVEAIIANHREALEQGEPHRFCGLVQLPESYTRGIAPPEPLHTA